MKTWALQDAKARLSTLVEQARRDGPQRITRRGEAMVVVMAADRFDQLTRRRHDHGLVRFFQDSPLAELPDDWLRREDDNGREVMLRWRKS
jgi:prevent-host-death family protein